MGHPVHLGSIYRVMCGKWYTYEHIRLTMAKVVSVLVFMVLLAAIVDGREWRFESANRVKRGYNTGLGSNNGGYGRSDEQDASVSRERYGCSEPQGGGSYGSGSRELPYDRDDRSSDRHHRFLSKATASASAKASATSFNQDHTNL
ncbi:uncharacterized protein LOC110377520 [Helicoverpa armigera]|uniref:uncharacterized protein LOC110377520 n=1 Tax=Helicoverpa armigera TaxID=29058 RepID=UPI003083D9E0